VGHPPYLLAVVGAFVMNVRALGVLFALVAAGLATVPTATATTPHTGDQITFEHCDEVFAFVTVPVDNVKGLLPAWLEPAELGGGVDVHLRTASCRTSIGGKASEGLSSEVRIPIRPPDGKQEDGLHLVGYQLSWATNDQRYASWVKQGTGLDSVMTLSKSLARTSSPDGSVISFDSPAPVDWAFHFDADAHWPTEETPKTPVVVDIYRHTTEGLVRFRAESRLPDGDRIGGADIDVTVPAGTALAALLDGAEECEADSDATRCHADALVYGYAVKIEDQPFTRTIIPDLWPASLEEARRATRKYADVTRALEAGYVPLSQCEETATGAMGIHFGNLELFDDRLDPARPELLLYLPSTDGLELVAVEYFIDAAVAEGHPTLFDRPLDGPMYGHLPLQEELQEGLHYDLHVWLFEWAPNPAGMFAPYNPDHRCVRGATEGALS
jgi:hypothetical protein